MQESLCLFGDLIFSPTSTNQCLELLQLYCPGKSGGHYNKETFDVGAI